jgi:putative transcriptional regulator
MNKRGKRSIASAEKAPAPAWGLADLQKFRAEIPEDIDVKAIRAKLGLTQRRFARCFGFTPLQIRLWEQARSSPHQSTRAYLLVIARNPRAVHEALASASSR